MKRHKFRLLALRILAPCLAVFLFLPALGQEEKTDYDRYIEAAKAELPILKSKRAVRYNFGFNGTPYHDPDGFKEGEASICGKIYHNLLVNYNSHLQTLETRQEKSPLTRTYDADDVEWFIRDGVKYINLKKAGYDVEEGFYEIVYEGQEVLYRRIDKSLETNTFSNNIMNIGYDDPLYRDNVNQFFNFKEAFFLSSGNGAIVRIKNHRVIYKRHPGSKKLARENLPYYNETDHAFWYRRLMELIENSGR